MADIQPPPTPRRRRNRRWRGRRRRRHAENVDNVNNADNAENGHEEDAPTTISTDGLEAKLSTVDVVDNQSEGQDCELHTYERRYDSYGDHTTYRVGTSSELEIPTSASHRAAIVLFRSFNKEGQLHNAYIEIRSKHIRRALKEVIPSYPGVNIHTTGYITIMSPPRCLFHFRKELEEYVENSSDQTAREHVRLCLGYMYRTLNQQLAQFNTTVNDQSGPGLEYENLWMAFKPGDLIFEDRDGVKRVSRLRELNFQPDPNIVHQSWVLKLTGITYDGTVFRYADRRMSISRYDGFRRVESLHIFPLDCHPETQQIREKLVARGKHYASLRGIQYRFTRGVGKYGELERKKSVKHRVIIDTETYIDQDHVYPKFHGANTPGGGTEAEGFNLSEEDLMMCDYDVYAYSLTLREWGKFYVDDIEEVMFNENAFSQLCLDGGKKELIQSLVPQYADEGNGFDDLIEGKGKGLVFLLHGPTGVGKTFTAESIADHTRRPLFPASSGDLLGTPKVVEARLRKIFQLAQRWGAIVLIDEADVFLQKRDVDSLERNALVSTMLRVLEYFEGILFLTTNRVTTIDSAFQSRVHLSVAYPPLSRVIIHNLWRETIIRGCSGHPSWLDDESLNTLSQAEVNGREIKNIVRMAHSIAKNDKRQMDLGDITKGVSALKTFQKDFYGSNV